MFKVLKTEGAARRGEFSCPHGTVQTPVFMNVGTQAAIKGALSAADLEKIGTQIELSNTYHLHLRPGDEVVRDMGGLHKFMTWNGPILTDSGGFQVFSLAGLRKIKEEGVTFASHLDGHKIFMGPEESMRIQSNLGSDIAMAFDECVENPATYPYAKASCERTARWLARCKEALAKYNAEPDAVNPGQQLWGINQGATFKDLRIWHMKEIAKLDLKDDVLRRANGFYTYFAADIAYHRNKFAVRGFDKVINIWGADHHGHVARLKGALDALGLNGSERLDIVLMQLVKLLRDGEVVRMSKRTGKAISLHDLLDEVSVDAARWYFNAKPDTQMEFDLGLAVREDSENPIYYVEYAHARICSLLRALETDGVTVPETADLSLLSGEAEKALIKQIAQYCEEIKLAARDYDPSHINRCLQELAACFHRFYTACRIRGEEPQVAAARLKLADDTRMVLKNGLKLIGVDAPEKM